MLTNASKYAIRAVLYLAENSSLDKKIGAKQIADDLEIPSHFIAKILQQLAKTNVISSYKGPHGGFFTTENDLSNNVCSILDVIENDKILDGCFLGLSRCDDNNPCPIHHIVSPFKEAIQAKFEHQSIADFSNEIKEEGSYLSLKDIIGDKTIF